MQISVVVPNIEDILDGGYLKYYQLFAECENLVVVNEYKGVHDIFKRSFDQLKYYVYRLLDPLNGETFYV